MNPEEETKVEESTENNNSENVEEVVEETDNTPTLEDYENLQKKNKELYERAKKAEALVKTKKEAPLIKNNETQSLSKEEVILYAKGYTDDEVEMAKKLAVLNGVTPLKAVEDEIFKAKYNARLKTEKSEKASLSPSTSGSKAIYTKPYKEMTEEEKISQFNKAMGN